MQKQVHTSILRKVKGRGWLTGAALLLTGSFGKVQAQCIPTEYYDQLMSSFHTTIAHNTNGTYSIWGAQSKASGKTSFTSPQVITASTTDTNAFNFTGTILKMTLASNTTTFQGFMLTTTNLYSWGGPSSSAVDGVTTGAFHSMSLPGSVTSADVKILTATTHALVVVTNSGAVYVLGTNSTYTVPMYGDNSSSSSTAWHQVLTSATGNPALSGVTQIALSGEGGIFAYVGATGKYYTWGANVYKGDGSAMSTLKLANEMTAPFSGAPKMIEATASGNSGLSYYALNPADGKIYTLGDNSEGQLGIGSTTAAKSWTNVLVPTSGTAALDSVIFISGNQHDLSYAGIGAIRANGTLYLWGENSYNMLGSSSAPITRPRVPDGFTAGTDKCLYVEVGGHTTVYVKDGTKKYCYVGHKINGSMGDGTTATATVTSFDCTSTADARICGATSFDAGDAPESYDESIVCFHDIVDNTTTLYLGATPPTFNNNNFKYVAAGADNTGANGEGWEEDGLSGPPSYFNTGSFSATITVKNTTGASKNLYGWIDWNNNGVFDVSEKVSATVPNAATTATLSWSSVPTTLVQDVKYYMRLRLTSDVLTSATGYASDGEVEDFYVKVPSYLPVASNVSTTMSNSNDKTAIPALVGSEPAGQITGFKITSLPAATLGTLYLCNPTCAAVAVNQVVSYADRAKLQFDPLGTAVSSSTFNYVSIDADTVSSPSASYTIITTNQPPVANNVASKTIASGVAAAMPSLKGYDADGTVSSYAFTSVPNTSTEGALTYCSTPPSTGCGTAVTAGATLTAAQIATLTFTPVAAYTGTLNVPYTVKDNNNNVSNTGYLTIPVKATASENRPPIADNIMNMPMNASDDKTLLAPLNGTDMTGVIDTYTITSLPASAAGVLYLCDPTCTAVTVGKKLTAAQKSKLQFDPAATYTGTATFNYTVTNSHATPMTSATATVYIPVANLAPVPQNIVYSAITRNTAANTTLSPLTASDADGTIAGYTILTLPDASTGTLYLCTTPPATGCTAVTASSTIALADVAKLTFKPAADFTGTASFTYTATDNVGAVGTAATYSVIVNNDPQVSGNPPVTRNLGTITTPGVAIAIASLIGTDADADLDHFVISAIPAPTEGVLQLCPTSGTCTDVTVGQSIATSAISQLKFIPASGYQGLASISYYAVDAKYHISNISDAKIQVTNVPPVAVDIAAPKQLNTAGAATLPSLSATDADGTVSSYMITSLPGANEGVLSLCTTPPATGCTPVTVGQVLTPAEAAKLTFNPQSTFTGYAKFGYTAIDNSTNIGNAAKMTIPTGSATALPLQLLSYSVQTQGCDAILNWTTTSDLDINKIDVQVSTDGQQFNTVATLNARAGNTTDVQSFTYHYTMTNTAGYMFRVALRNISGSIVYSNVERVSCNGRGQNVITAPNPVSDVLQVSGADNASTLQLYQTDGRLLQSVQMQQGTTNVDMRQYPKGVYLLKITGADGNATQRTILKQ